MLDLDDQIAAGPRPAGAEKEGPLAAEARDHIQASVVGVELGRPEGRVDELACLSPGLGNVCTSVMKDPSTVSAPLWSVKEESSRWKLC